MKDKKLYNDFTDSVQEHIQSLLTKGIKFEITIGTLIEKISQKRINLNVLHPVLLQEKLMLFEFNPNIDAKLIDKILKKHIKTDEFEEQIVYYENREYKINENIEKTIERIFHIYLPNLNFDLRIKIFTEKQCENKEITKNVAKINKYVKRYSNENVILDFYSYKFYVQHVNLCLRLNQDNNIAKLLDYIYKL